MGRRGSKAGGWKAILQALINAHNGRHATRGKVASHKTQEERAASLFRTFKRLRVMGFKLDDPASFGERHIGWLVRDWIADPTLVEVLAQRGVLYKVRPAPLSPAYIQQQLSFLRVFARWIGKPGMIGRADTYAPRELVARSTAAQSDHTWEGNDVDAAEVLARVAARDPRTALILEVMLAFGLRRKEAVMFVPAHAEVPKYAVPANAQSGAYLAFLRVKRGTKGGRLRYTAIRNPAQVRALEHARESTRDGGHIGYQGLSLKQALRRFSNMLYRAGVTRRLLGVTGHGLRHQFAADLYYELADVAPPVRGGAPVDADMMQAAYLEIAHQLGHGRPQISSAYLGARNG